MADVKDIQAALKLLDPKDDSQWTREGLPVIECIQQIVQEQVSRAQVTAADPQFNRAAALAAADDAEKIAVAKSAKPPVEPPQPMAAPSSELADLEAHVEEAEAEVAAAHDAVAKAQRNLAAVQAKRDRLVAVRNVAVPHDVNQKNIMTYLEGQKRIREARAARSKQFFDAGVDLKMLASKAPVDAAMARKRGFGLNRPQVPMQNVAPVKPAGT